MARRQCAAELKAVRIVSWNCAGAFRRKADAVAALNPDVLVILECEDPSRHAGRFRGWEANYVWGGINPNKGIGIFCGPEVSLQRLDWDAGGLAEFLPVRIYDKFNLLAVWTQYADRYADRYVGQACQYLHKHAGRISDETIICGDFNSNAIWDTPKREWTHRSMIADLEQAGFASLYHHQTGEQQGCETTPTFYLYRKLDRPYHIDYVFLHRAAINGQLASFAIGQPADWLSLSDHLPLVTDLLSVTFPETLP